MAKITIESAFVEGYENYALKVTEPHSRQDESGNWKTVSRTFHRVKASRQSGINLESFAKGERVTISGTQKTEVFDKRDGTKGYSLVVYVDSIERAGDSTGFQGVSNAPAQAPAGSGSFGADFAAAEPF